VMFVFLSEHGFKLRRNELNNGFPGIVCFSTNETINQISRLSGPILTCDI
jgi:hypothetical protein